MFSKGQVCVELEFSKLIFAVSQGGNPLLFLKNQAEIVGGGKSASDRNVIYALFRGYQKLLGFGNSHRQ